MLKMRLYFRNNVFGDSVEKPIIVVIVVGGREV